MLTYEFVSEKLHTGTCVKRPKVLVTLVGKKRSMNFLALLDSGTDISMIPRTIADSLGIDYAKNSKETVLGFDEETFLCADCKINLIFKSQNDEQDEHIYKLPALVMLTDIENEVILGCEGIFDNFKITFHYRNKITMERNKIKN